MRIPLLSGVLTDKRGEFLTSYPVNLEVVPVDDKIAAAQFSATSGAVSVGQAQAPTGAASTGTAFNTASSAPNSAPSQALALWCSSATLADQARSRWTTASTG
jgi:hypothetical protein